MSVRRFLCYDLADSDTPVAAVAYDSATREVRSTDPELATALRNKIAAARVAGRQDDALEILRYNLPFLTGEVTEHQTVASALRF